MIIVNRFHPLTIIAKRSILDVAVVLDPPLLQILFKPCSNLCPNMSFSYMICMKQNNTNQIFLHVAAACNCEIVFPATSRQVIILIVKVNVNMTNNVITLLVPILTISSSPNEKNNNSPAGSKATRNEGTTFYSKINFFIFVVSNFI